MSLLDARYPELDLFLQRWRRRLNFRFRSGEALVGLAWAAPASLLTAFVAGPDEPLRWMLWSGSSVILAAAFTLARAGKGLGRSEAASWLDERSGSIGLFRAASECLEKESLGPAERAVVEAADRRRGLLSGPLAPRLPWRRWLARAALATAFVGASVGGVGWSLPAWIPARAGEGSPGEARNPKTPSGLPDAGSPPLGPKEAAKRLFPEDERLAALAEQALASGDPSALAALLEQNAEAVNRSALPPGAGSAPPGGAGSQPGEEGQNNPGTGSPDPGQKGAARSQGSENGSPGGSQDKSPSSQGSRDPSASGGNRGDGGQPQGKGREGTPGSSGDRGGTASPFGSGGAPGVGHSDQPLDAAPNGRSPRTLTLKEPSAQGLFEYVLPGSEARLPTAQTLADSRRSAEAVLSRTSPPLEFEKTIRDYFLSLSRLPLAQEVSP